MAQAFASYPYPGSRQLGGIGRIREGGVVDQFNEL